MKTRRIAILALTMTMTFMTDAISQALVGAWEMSDGNRMTRTIFSEGYFATTVFNIAEKTFDHTYGGAWRKADNEIVQVLEFHSKEPALVGTEVKIPVVASSGELTVTRNGAKERWKRLDDGTPGKLAGAWLITGRMQDGEMHHRTPGVRKTMKILSGTCFQWIAYNTETKEFSGTGGGTYTTEGGKYTENIQFFSRDNSRVGASLQFDFALEDGNWRHSGLSSRGDPIDEVWTRREKLDP